MIDEELFKKMLMTFDHKYEAASVFYDNLPYVRDYDLCNWTPLRMVSGNIIKYYQYKLDKPVIPQTDSDGYKKNILLSRSQNLRSKRMFFILLDAPLEEIKFKSAASTHFAGSVIPAS